MLKTFSFFLCFKSLALKSLFVVCCLHFVHASFYKEIFPTDAAAVTAVPINILVCHLKVTSLFLVFNCVMHLVKAFGAFNDPFSIYFLTDPLKSHPHLHVTLFPRILFLFFKGACISPVYQEQAKQQPCMR